MDTWLIIVIFFAVDVLALVLWGVTRGRERRLESRRVEAGELREQAEPAARYAKDREVAARDELARGAGVASFGLNLPWRRARRDSSGSRPARR